MSVAQFLYEHVYCRYLAPGEAIIHDRGPEFANQVSRHLHESFGVEIRIISTGRPQANGQAEALVKKLKQRMICLMSEDRNIHNNYMFYIVL
jgi:transposase InsO family protein